MEEDFFNQNLLSIAIPTFNRIDYLKDLLPSLIEQTSLANSVAKKVEIVISDNASTDGTGEYVDSFCTCNECVRYFRNKQNLGGIVNLAKAVERSNSSYVWVVGDDDLFEQNAVPTVISVIETYKPSLIICIDALKIVGKDPAIFYCNGTGKTTLYQNYREFLTYFSDREIDLIPAHTWIPSTIFLNGVFDRKLSQEMLSMDYSHIYAITSGLKTGGRICVINTPVVKLRNVRAPHQYKNIPQKQEKYLLWLAATYNNKKIRNYVLKRKIKRIIRFPFSLSKRIVKRLLNTLHILNCN